MKRLQIMIDEDLDAELALRALVQHTSKAALIRTYVRERVRPLPPIEEDSLWSMVGMDDFEPADIDERRERRTSSSIRAYPAKFSGPNYRLARAMECFRAG